MIEDKHSLRTLCLFQYTQPDTCLSMIMFHVKDVGPDCISNSGLSIHDVHMSVRLSMQTFEPYGLAL
mgnify:FL=1